MNVDPLAEKYFAWSSYNYTMGNPVNLIDPDGRSPEWIPEVKDYGIILKKEEGDDAESLADFLDIDQELANVLYNSSCPDGTVELSNDVPGIRNISGAIQDYKFHPDNYGGWDFWWNYNYDCHESSLSLITKTWINKSNVIEGYEFANTIRANNFVDVTKTPEDYRFGVTLIRFSNTAGNSVHSATYLGTSKDGTIYTWSKQGNVDKPGIFTVKQLENHWGSKVQGLGPEKGGGFYNP